MDALTAQQPMNIIASLAMTVTLIAMTVVRVATHHLKSKLRPRQSLFWEVQENAK